ncbi:MAG: hypothetical protein ACRDU8_04875 [Egibacteraceae bacterium]
MIVLAVPDGAADPPGNRRTCLEEARTSTLDALLTGGVLQRVATIPDSLPVGTEVGLPSLLGVELDAPLPRGLIEAAAADITLSSDEGAWRIDLVPSLLHGQEVIDLLDAAVRPLGGQVHRLSGHRFLLTGPRSWGAAPAGPHQTTRPLADIAAGAFAAIVEATADALTGTGAHAWPWGALPAGDLPNVPDLLGCPYTVVTCGGPAQGIALLLGCDVATGKSPDVVAAAPAGSIVVVHDPGPDDAGHARDRAGKVAAIERFDREVLTPIVDVLERRGGGLVVSPDHGCDPATGRHTADPVPAVLWSAGSPAGGDRPRMTERDASHLAAVPAYVLLAEQLALHRHAA